MKKISEIDINLCFNNEHDYDSFRSIIEKALTKTNIKNKKKVLIIATELIQNNIIHNESNPSVLKIFEAQNSLHLEISQNVDKYKLSKITNLINSINNLSIDLLKDTYKKNIISADNNQVGNGLILCRLKSGNKIGTTVKQNLNNKDFNIQIAIKF